MTEFELSREPYSQKSGWITHSNERFFFKKITIHSVVLSVMANIVQSLIGDWKCITVADQEGSMGSPLPRY